MRSMLEKIFVVACLLLFAGAVVPLLQEKSGLVPDTAQGDPIMQAILAAVFATTFFLAAARYRTFLQAARADKLLLLLIAVALVSAAWSRAPEVTLRRSLALCATTMFGVYVAMRFSLREQLKLLGWTLGIAAMLTVITALFLPEYGVMTEVHEGAWRGIFVHKNVLGRLMALSAVVFLVLALGMTRRRWMYWSGLLLCTGLLFSSDSKTAVVALPTLLLLFPLFRLLHIRFAPALTVLLGVLLLGGGALTWSAENTDLLAQWVGRDLTLTGRTAIWGLVLLMIARQPWLGYGYSAFWLTSPSDATLVSTAVNWSVPHAHNGFLDLWLELGAVGVLLFLVGLGAAFRRAVRWARMQRTAEGLWPLCYLSFMLLYNLTESAILKQNSIFWVLYVATAISLALATRTAQTQCTSVTTPNRDHAQHRYLPRPIASAV